MFNIDISDHWNTFCLVIPLQFAWQRRVATCCDVLQFSEKDDTLSRYPTGYKGGYRDCDGRPVAYSKGGSRAHSQKAIYRQTVLARRGDTCDQDGRWDVAGESVGRGRISQEADAQQSRERALTIGKLTISLSATCRCVPNVFQALSTHLFARCFIPIIANVANHLQGGEVAGSVFSMLSMPAYPIRTSERGVWM